MKYVLDNNIFPNNPFDKILKRHDVAVIEDVLDEARYTKQEIAIIQKQGVTILKPTKKHFIKLKEVMATHGDNYKLINLYLGTGAADVMMIAYILAERDYTQVLFPEEYIIVTKDTELTTIASSYGIQCVQVLPES